MVTVGFFPAHPAQFWMMKALYDNAPSGVVVQWFIRDKDVTKELINSFDIQYTLVSKAQKGLIGNAIEFIGNIAKFIHISKKAKINVWLSKYGAVNISARLLKIKNISFNDDDIDIIPLIALTSYPFADKILCTNWTRMDKFLTKTTFYPSFHELFYLHPNRFIKDAKLVLKALDIEKLSPYVIVRLSSLEAHHDIKAKGISDELLNALISLLRRKHRVYISSEKELSSLYKPFQLKIEPKDLHQILAHSSACIADSQTMIAEAAVLGIPALRISSFSQKIGYLDELERRGLCKSIHPKSDGVIMAIQDLITNSETEKYNVQKRLIEETIDPIGLFWQELIQDTLI